jgi:hypothetical protein
MLADNLADNLATCSGDNLGMTRGGGGGGDNVGVFDADAS